MKFKELFEKMQVAITFAEAGLPDEARKVMSEGPAGDEGVPRRAVPRLSAEGENLHSIPARG